MEENPLHFYSAPKLLKMPLIYYFCRKIHMAKRIIMITGGQRSGKSEQAEAIATSLSVTPVYLATAIADPSDEEMQRRIASHRARRGSQWTNIEEPLHLAAHDLTGRTVLIDCITMWITNIFFGNNEDVQRSYEVFAEELQRLIEIPDTTLIFVTNEIGLGGISANSLQRRFTDLQGLANRLVAVKADEVIMMISGIPLMIKQ